MTLSWEAWYTVAVLSFMFYGLLKNLARPDFMLMGCLALFLIPNIITPTEAFSGFSNPAIITIGSLFIVASAIQRTGSLQFVAQVITPYGTSLHAVLARMMVFTATFSGFLNNTPLVAMLMPQMQDWATENNHSSSKLLIPLSYAAIVGGMTTLIGTSTNLLVYGLLEAKHVQPFGFFDFSWIGIPVCFLVLLYFLTIGYRLLPDNKATKSVSDSLRAYQFELLVTSDAKFIGKSIEEAGLRSLGNAYLIHIQKKHYHITSVHPTDIIELGDILTFSGTVEAMNQLLKRKGLNPTSTSEENEPLPLFEAVLSSYSSLLGKTLKEVKFREKYGGVVLGIQRNQDLIAGPLGNVKLNAGDLLLIEAKENFDVKWQGERQEFYLVVPIGHREHQLERKAPIALSILVVMVLCVVIDLLPLSSASFLAGITVVATGCLRGTALRESVDFSVLVVIGAALGIGEAIISSGLASSISHLLSVSLTNQHILLILFAIYIATNLLTELISNQGAAVLMFPISYQLALELGIDPKVMGLLIAIAASASFLTPIGYQTNLMVMNAGNYTFADFLKAGLPVSLIVMITSVFLIYTLWI